MADEQKEPEAMSLVKLEPQALMQAAIDRGASIETLERLIALAKDVAAEQARRAWHQAMAAFQETCPPITKNKEARIATRTGPGYSYSYAPLAQIMSTIGPVMGPLGLHVSYRMQHEGAASVTAICIVSHELGHHEESGPVTIPIISSDPSVGANPMQRVGIAESYAKRYALLAIIGLAPQDEDDDAGGAVAPSTVRQPERTAPPQAQAQQAEAVLERADWRGVVAAVTQRAGGTKEKPWTLYTIRGEDGETFGTFSATDATFAKEAGKSAVLICWEKDPKGYRKVVSIGPADAS